MFKMKMFPFLLPRMIWLESLPQTLLEISSSFENRKSWVMMMDLFSFIVIAAMRLSKATRTIFQELSY